MRKQKREHRQRKRLASTRCSAVQDFPACTVSELMLRALVGSPYVEDRSLSGLVLPYLLLYLDPLESPVSQRC